LRKLTTKIEKRQVAQESIHNCAKTQYHSLVEVVQRRVVETLGKNLPPLLLPPA